MNQNQTLPDEHEEFGATDPLIEVYTESITEHPAHTEILERKDTALLIIDMQFLDAAEGHGVFRDATASGVPPEAQAYYFKELKERVIPNIQLLQECFRRHRMEVIHTRIQSLTQDGRDRSPAHKRLGLLAAPGSKEAEFLPEVAPVGDEVVINKTASGVFTSTNLHYVLRNMGIKALFVAGVYTNECVSTTVRDGCDLGLYMTLIDDACATVTEDLHQFSVHVLRDRYARVRSSEEAIEEIESLLPIA